MKSMVEYKIIFLNVIYFNFYNKLHLNKLHLNVIYFNFYNKRWSVYKYTSYVPFFSNI